MSAAGGFSMSSAPFHGAMGLARLDRSAYDEEG